MLTYLLTTWKLPFKKCRGLIEFKWDFCVLTQTCGLKECFPRLNQTIQLSTVTELYRKISFLHAQIKRLSNKYVLEIFQEMGHKLANWRGGRG